MERVRETSQSTQSTEQSRPDDDDVFKVHNNSTKHHSSNIHFKAVPGSFNITKPTRPTCISAVKIIACSCGHHPFLFIPVINFVCAVGGLCF